MSYERMVLVQNPIVNKSVLPFLQYICNHLIYVIQINILRDFELMSWRKEISYLTNEFGVGLFVGVSSLERQLTLARRAKKEFLGFLSLFCFYFVLLYF